MGFSPLPLRSAVFKFAEHPFPFFSIGHIQKRRHSFEFRHTQLRRKKEEDGKLKRLPKEKSFLFKAPVKVHVTHWPSVALLF